MARSNAVMFEVFEIPVLDNVGWQVQVISASDFYKQSYYREIVNNQPKPVPLTVIGRYIELSISLAISEVGAGSIALDMDDDMWQHPLTDGSPAGDLLEREHLWMVYESGSFRGAFLGQVIEEDILPTGDGDMRIVRISGPGPADVLRWGVVFNMHYPALPPTYTDLDVIDESTPPTSWQFKEGPMLRIFLYLLFHAWRRHTLEFVNPDFGQLEDSDGLPWKDMPKKSTVTATPETKTVDVNFFPDSTTLSDQAAGTIVGTTAEYQDMEAPQVTVVGHTDATGSHASNQILSEQRANAVADLIRSRVPQVVLNVSGKGETQPIAPNNTVFGREKNRRATITYPIAPDPVFVPDYYTVTEGMNYLDVLREVTGYDYDRVSPVRYEWLMREPFHLEVRKQFGSRREKDVIFYDASTHTSSKSRERRRSEIVNSVWLHGNLGGYTGAGSLFSQARWGKRESWQKQSESFDMNARGAIAMTMMLSSEREAATWQFKVAPFGQGRRMFVDYNLGDWIGISQFRGASTDVVEAFRVMAITVKVSSDNSTDVELTLQSTRDTFVRRLQSRLTALLAHKDAPQIYVQDEEPRYARPGDLWTTWKEIDGP